MNPSIKTAALFLATVCLLLSLAACGKSEPAQQEISDSAVVTQMPAESQSVQSDETETETTTKLPVTEKVTEKTVALPQSTAQWIAVYNQALQKRAPKCTSSAQKITQGKLWLGNKSDESMDLLAEEQAQLLARFEQNSVSNTALVQLSEGDVTDASVTKQTVTFSLGSVSTDGSVSQGKGGYIAIVDDARTQELVDGVKAYANVSGDVKISAASYRLSEGELQVTFDADFREIVEAKYTAKQDVTAKMRYLIMTINADLDYQIRAEFK